METKEQISCNGKFTHRCDITGKGMNKGYCWSDGVFYSATFEDTVKELRKDIGIGAIDTACYDTIFINKELLEMGDETLIEWAYSHEILYWTEWYEADCNDWFYDAAGNEYQYDEQGLAYKV